MFELFETVLIFLTIFGILAVLGIKEYAGYRLPASHRLNVLLNPPKASISQGARLSQWTIENAKFD